MNNNLPKVPLITIEMLSLIITIGNPFIKDKATEFASIESFNNWMKDISVQADYEEYFPKIVKIGKKLLIVSSPCKII